MATNLEIALEYAGRGWRTFPCHFPIAKGKCSCGNPECGSPAKHPMTRNGVKEATTDRDKIKSWWTKAPNANIAIATGHDSGLVVVDIDPRHGGLDSMKAISKLGSLPSLTPTVATGGGGEHIYLAYPNNGSRMGNTVQLGGYQGIDLRGDGGYVIAPPSKHISGSKYTWKVKHIGKAPGKMPDWFYELAASRRPSAAISQEIAFNNIDKYILSRGGVTDVTPIAKEGSRDNAIFNLVKTLRKGGMSYDEVCYHAVLFAQYGCDPPMPSKVAIEKVQSTWNAERNLGAEIRDYVECYGGVISLQGVTNELCIVTERDKALLRVTMSRLVKAKVLERIENKPGLFRKVDSDLEIIDLFEDDGQPLDLKWPFGLENLVDIYQKNIVICAGSKDSGKSAFALSTVKMNMHKWDVRYFSSEMGSHELKRRLRRFDDLRISDWKFKPYLRATKFADVVFPEALNIIDYLEISKDFSIIADEIRQIYDKLTTGIALICIQKDPKAPLGRGSSFSLEKARMYLTLDRTQFHNICTIVSGKNWHQEGLNPSGITIKFKTINGARLLEMEST